ncbi:MAG: hypothetical protein EZS28_013400 [Streblomastix strix]|uniref:Right handed beta helix domain-containing protein n=1 Tax=Streblomastix strix TaxID=222440 RepID=A0A5J4W8W2_9EUKA|nr:MAG: hypothetical protein EZS28_013400 [Streblomastix strix]
MKIERAMIESYKLINENSIITIKSQSFSQGRYRKNEIEIYQTTFSNIQKLGAGNGAAINAQLDQDSVLKVTDSCTFYNCSTELIEIRIGGAITAVVNGSNSKLIISDLVKFEKCQSFRGGAINVEILNMGSCVVNNVQFKECTVSNDGGGIHALLRETGGTSIKSNWWLNCKNMIDSLTRRIGKAIV